MIFHNIFKPIFLAENDYKFVYIGPKDSWTPFHYDVFGSFSWSANVVGRKHWIFVPPGQEKLLMDQRENLPFDIFDTSVKGSFFVF